MKYYITALSLLMLFSCSKKDSTANLHISGNIQDLTRGTLYIQKIEDTSLVVVDSIIVDGSSKFESDIQIDSPEMYYLSVDTGDKNINNNLAFFAEPGNITIETSLKNFSYGAKITGSHNQSKYEEFRKVITRFNDQNLSLTEQKFHAFKNNNRPSLDSIDIKQNLNLKRRYLYVANFALNNKDFELSPYLTLTEIPDINLKLMDTIQKSMTPKVAGSKYGKKLIEFYKQRKLAGN